jgi:hypothetical protein
MKKFVGIFALALALASQQQASAWVNARFGVGLNIQYQSGNNCWLWGALRNGQVPGAESFDGFGHHGFGHHGHHGFGHHGQGHGFGFDMGTVDYGYPVTAPAQASSPRYTAPYYNASYGYYTMPVYYYPMSWYGR